MIVLYSTVSLYMENFRVYSMQKIQLLSIVFSLIMFTGITAGTAIAYAGIAIMSPFKSVSGSSLYVAIAQPG